MLLGPAVTLPKAYKGRDDKPWGCSIYMPSICLQTDVNEKMRAILVDWLVEVHLKFKVGRWGGALSFVKFTALCD